MTRQVLAWDTSSPSACAFLEEANPPVAQSASDTQNDQSNLSGSVPSADLGANEWLVEEMRDQYDADPGSVGPEWKRYFESNGSPGNGASPTAARARPAQAAQPAQPAQPRSAQPAQPRPAPAKQPEQRQAPAPERATKTPAEAEDPTG